MLPSRYSPQPWMRCSTVARLPSNSTIRASCWWRASPALSRRHVMLKALRNVHALFFPRQPAAGAITNICVVVMKQLCGCHNARIPFWSMLYSNILSVSRPLFTAGKRCIERRLAALHNLQHAWYLCCDRDNKVFVLLFFRLAQRQMNTRLLTHKSTLMSRTQGKRPLKLQLVYYRPAWLAHIWKRTVLAHL